MKIHRPLAAALLAASSGLLQAEEIDTYELKPNLVVTPSRRVEPLDQSLASVSVITREDIEISVAEDLFELLRLQPGVDIVRAGGPGTQTSIFLRGSNSNHVPVLIDGVRVSSTNTGAYAWEQLPLNQVERVEIVRGPRGSLYGSDSLGGVPLDHDNNDFNAIIIDLVQTHTFNSSTAEVRKPQVARLIRVAGSTLFHGISGSCGISPVLGFCV